MPTTDRYYIPVCLYPHTKYRTSAGLSALFQKFALRDHDHLIVIADRLHVLDRLVTGRYWTVSSARNKANKEARQILSLIRRISSRAKASGRGKILCWDDIAETADYLAFAKRLQDAVLNDDMLAEAIRGFVESRVLRYGRGAFPERERSYEQDYLLSEVSMSVFCTEMLGFSTEIWERPPKGNVPDPLKLLYEERRDLVSEVTGRQPARVLTFLFTDETQIVPDEKYEQHRPVG